MACFYKRGNFLQNDILYTFYLHLFTSEIAIRILGFYADEKPLLKGLWHLKGLNKLC